MNGNRPLNPKQTAFVAEYLKDRNGTQAAIRAGYARKNADVRAAQLLGILRIKEAIAANQAQLLKEAGFTVREAYAKYQHIYELAVAGGKKGQLSAAAKAVEGMCKLYGLLIDKVEHSFSLASFLKSAAGSDLGGDDDK